MLRSNSVALGAVFAALLLACAEDEADQEADTIAVCVEQGTDIRVDDDRCPDDDSGTSVGSPFLWYYLGRSSAAPAVGSPVTGGSYVRPASGSIGRAGFGGGKGFVGG